MVTAQDVELFTALVRALSWPIVALALLFYFGPALRERLPTSDVSVKGMGIEVTLQRGFAAGANYGMALAEKSPGMTPEEFRAEIEDAAAETTPESVRRLKGARLLWVDDNPQNNVYERNALEDMGVRVTISTSTEDALAKLDASDFDVVISDMGRPENERAGYDLLERKQESGNRTPFVIYAGSNKEEHKREARRRGAIGSTNRPAELFRLVNSAVEE